MRVAVQVDDQEFLASESAHDVRATSTSTQHRGSRTQDVITDVVTVSIVDVLEVIDVDDEHGERSFEAHRFLPFLFQPFHRVAAIGQLGQYVRVRGCMEFPRHESHLRDLARPAIAVAAHLMLQLDHATSRGDPRHQDARVVGLADEVIGAGVECGHDLLFLVARGQHESVDLPSGLGRAQRAQEIPAVHARHEPVGQDDVWRVIQDDLECGLAVWCRHHAVATRREVVFQQSEDARIVVDGEDTQFQRRHFGDVFRHLHRFYS